MLEVTKSGIVLSSGHKVMEFRSQAAAVAYLKRQPRLQFWCW